MYLFLVEVQFFPQSMEFKKFGENMHSDVTIIYFPSQDFTDPPQRSGQGEDWTRRNGT